MMTTCSWCGRILKDYTGRGTPYCPGCAQKEAEAFKKIVSASNRTPCQTALQYSANTGLPLRIVEHFIDNGKLKIRKN